jgi:hypothetical protein
MSTHGRIALFGFAALLVFTLLAGLARNFHSREQERFAATVMALEPAGPGMTSPNTKLTKLEATTADGRTITVVSSRKQAPAPGDRITVSTRTTLWGQTWYALAE